MQEWQKKLWLPCCQAQPGGTLIDVSTLIKINDNENNTI